jgi:hypothetical protein
MQKQNNQPGYRAFLIRLWREDENSWRGTVEDPHSGQQKAFAEVDLLLAYIRNQVQPEPPPPE